jgi:hypothetical protein
MAKNNPYARKYTQKQLEKYLAKYGYRIVNENDGRTPGIEMEYLNSVGSKKIVMITNA